MSEYVASQSDENNFIITIMEGDYKGVVVKIVDLQMDEDGSLSFEMELPKNRTELFEDTKFQDVVGRYVGDIVKKSIDMIWKSQQDLTELETKVGEILDKHLVQRPKDKLIVETFMEKGFLLKKEEPKEEGGKEHFVAIDVKANKSYDLEDKKDWRFINSKVFTNIILN